MCFRQILIVKCSVRVFKQHAKSKSQLTDHGAIARWHDLFGAGRQLDTGTLRLRIVRDDGGVVARCSRQTAAITGLLLEVADDRSLRHRADRQDISDLEVG